MDLLLFWKSDYQLIILIGILIIINLFFMGQIIFLKRSFKKITFDNQEKSFVNILKNILSNQNNNIKDINKIYKLIDQNAHKSKNYYQKIGFNRFSPFDDTGGMQSFVFTLLNNNNDGIVITSLHGRANTRVYAKQIFKGKCDEVLSSEEKKVLARTI